MPRFLVERVYGQAEEEAMQDIGVRSKRAAEQLPGVTWEHSHVVADESRIKSYCVYGSPDVERLHEHAKLVGGHTILRIYEIAGDVTPGDFPD